MINEHIKEVCKEKEQELLNKYFGNFVREAAIECPETIGAYTKDLPLKVEAEYKTFLEGLWKEHAPENCRFTWTNTKEEHEKELDDPNVLTLAIKAKDDRRIVGDVIIDLDYESEWFEIKRLSMKEKNRGYGRETITALTKYAFEELKMNKVWFEAYPDNQVGRHLYESMKFHVDGVLRQHHKTPRGILDQIQYSMLKGEYEELKRRGMFGDLQTSE